MEKMLEGHLPSIASSLERIANALEKAPVENVKPVKELVQEEIKEINDSTLPEEKFIQKVENLNRAFQDLVDSFANGEAMNFNYMNKYPFESFSIVELSISVNEWVHSIKTEGTKKED